MLGDLDGNGRGDAIWLYDLPDGPHLQIRSDRGVTDAIRLGFGQQAVALGLSQVDLIVGGADPGTAQEILAVVSGSDGTRLVGVYTLALRTGCLDEFEFAVRLAVRLPRRAQRHLHRPPLRERRP